MKNVRPIHQDQHHRSSRRKSTEKYDDKEIEQVKEKEGQQILAKIKPQINDHSLKYKERCYLPEGLAKN